MYFDYIGLYNLGDIYGLFHQNSSAFQSCLNQFNTRIGVKFIKRTIEDRNLFSFNLNNLTSDLRLMEELIIRRYRYIFTTLAVTARVVNTCMYPFKTSTRTNHFMRNPSIGGIPPMLA